MVFRITQGDTSPSLVSTLTDSGAPVDLTGANEVRFIMENKYEQVVIEETESAGDVQILDADAGEVEFIFDDGETDTAGTYKAEWEVEYSTGATETFPTGRKIEVIIGEQIA